MRVFIGLPLDQAWVEKIKAIQQEWKPKFNSKISWPLPTNHHITLKFLGEIKEGQVEPIKKALTQITFKPFSLTFTKVGFFYTKKQIRVVWIGFKEDKFLRKLFKEIEDSLYALGFAREQRNFVPHLTLARVKKFLPEDPWQDFAYALNQQAWSSLKLERLVLWHSVLQPQGPLYKPLLTLT